MKALIHGTRVCQIEEKEFPVHPSLQWIDCPIEVKPEWIYENGQFLPPAPPPEPTTQQKIAATDMGFIRVSEDAIVALITKGILAKTDFPQAAIDKINYRRSLRGLAPL